MATNFYFRSIFIDNYRGLKNLNLERAKRINIIGGLNGTGKSTLLDALFLVLDRRSPGALVRPLNIRGAPIPYPNGLDFIFNSTAVEKKAIIKCSTSDSTFKVEIAPGSIPSNVSISSTNINGQNINIVPATIEKDSTGIHIKTYFDGNSDFDEGSFVFQGSHEFVNYNLYKLTHNKSIAPGAYISATARISMIEDASRFTILIKEKRSQEVVECMKFVIEDLSDLQILQEGNQPALYATMKDGSMHQTSVLGGGFQIVLSVILLLMTTKNGVLFFDEVDTAIHYSRLKFFWELVSKVASKNNCQVFAVTHSRECVSEALSGVLESGNLADLQYIRLENDDKETDVITYSGEELRDALAGNWEIR